MPDKAITRGAHHVGLTVPDLAQARAFFTDVLGYAQVGERPDYPAVFVSDGSVMITLWQAAEPQTVRGFDRKNQIGLHHLALKVENTDALAALHRTLADTDGVEIEFAPQPLGDIAVHMMCAIPGGIRTEFIALSS